MQGIHASEHRDDASTSRGTLWKVEEGKEDTGEESNLESSESDSENSSESSKSFSSENSDDSSDKGAIALKHNKFALLDELE